MNINELREKWHRDAEQAHDWHEQAWHLMRELDDARTECARAVAGYNDLARRVDDLACQLAAERRVLADSRRREESLRLELGATKASLKFALETNKRLKAERDAADTRVAALLNNDLTARLEAIAATQRPQRRLASSTEGDRMSEVDTTAIRAASRGNTYRYLAGIVTVLCDALDAARAKREEALASVERWMIAEYESSQRAEVAEAEVAQWRVWADDALTDARARAEAAEARIGAALAELYASEWPNERIDAARRALTEGTDQ